MYSCKFFSDHWYNACVFVLKLFALSDNINVQLRVPLSNIIDRGNKAEKIVTDRIKKTRKQHMTENETPTEKLCGAKKICIESNVQNHIKTIKQHQQEQHQEQQQQPKQQQPKQQQPKQQQQQQIEEQDQQIEQQINYSYTYNKKNDRYYNNKNNYSYTNNDKKKNKKNKNVNYIYYYKKKNDN